MIYNVNKFWHYLLGQKFTFHFDHSALLYVVSKRSLADKLTRWTLLLQEFEFDIFHRLGLQHAVADYLSPPKTGEPGIGVQDDFPDAQLFRIEADNAAEVNDDTVNSWIIEMTIFLSTGLPPDGMSPDERKQLVVRSRNFYLVKEIVYHKGTDGIWSRAIRQFDKSIILKEGHSGIAGGHIVEDTTAWKIWNSWLWWPTTMKDAVEYCWQCDLCQHRGQPNERDCMPYQPVVPLDPFQMWGLDFVGHSNQPPHR